MRLRAVVFFAAVFFAVVSLDAVVFLAAVFLAVLLFCAAPLVCVVLFDAVVFFVVCADFAVDFLGAAVVFFVVDVDFLPPVRLGAVRADLRCGRRLTSASVSSTGSSVVRSPG